jgi:aspartyl-tRNA(Asn)/glutamyl-tRNA(Gln) amidotransferase subunit C
MEKLTREQVEHIANLANIKLTDGEVQLFRDQLTSVIDYNMRLLSEVNVENVAPTAQTTGLENVWRDDETKTSLATDLALSQAPLAENDQFKVKRVLGES